ncbi:hypothetical protein K439DRAFT_1612402 [Ramaria rubella]|nr:hypothetical protein K439DRAFT_1612402 [Ramaria rubella]
MAILFYRRPALNISPKRTRSSALASPIKMLEENTRGTIVGDGANLADGISPMHDLESAPQLLKRKTSQASGQVEEPRAWYENDSKPYMRWSFFMKTSILTYQKSRCVRTELPSGSSSTLIGDTPPSKSMRSRKPSLAVDVRVKLNTSSRLSTINQLSQTFHPSAIDCLSAATGSHGSRVHSVPTKYIPTVVVPTRSQSRATKNLSDNAPLTIKSQCQKSGQIAEMTSEESKEDVGSLANFIVDHELDEDETSDVVNNDKVNHCGSTKDAQEEYIDKEVEDLGFNAEVTGQEEDMKEDTRVLESDNEDEHSAASMILRQKRHKGKGRVVEDTEDNSDSHGEYGTKA